MKIAVAGATGRVGAPLARTLAARGHDVVPMSRSTGVDVVTGAGLDQALDGVQCVIDASAGASNAQEDATRFCEAAARNLHEAGEKAGVQRIVMISIIGVDKFTAGYMAAKAAHERAMVAGPIPVGILRAAQFHEFVGPMMNWGRHGDVASLPQMRTQLVAAEVAADGLADLATGPSSALAPGPAGMAIPEVAGPRPELLANAAALLAHWNGDPVKIEVMSDSGDPDRDLYATGALLPGPGAKLAGPTFAEWLRGDGGGFQAPT